ncbi:MAG: hypothetical protein RL258_138, partial [Pseudomonadota bacterium]
MMPVILSSHPRPLRALRPLACLAMSAWLSSAAVAVQAQTTDPSASKPPSAASAVFQILASELALQQGQAGVAVATYVALAERTRDAGVAERATRVALLSRQARQALRSGAVWLEVSPDNTDAQDIVDLLRLQLGFYSDLRNNLLARKALAQKAGSLDAFLERLAGLASQGQDPAKSLALLEGVAEADQSRPGILYARAMLYERLQDHKTMESLLRALMDQQPEHAHAKNALGYSLADRGIRLEEAEALIEEAHRLLPEDAHILDSMGWLYFRKGELDKAVQWLSDAHRRQP